jgi:thiol:disulfide interchange protein DsbD
LLKRFGLFGPPSVLFFSPDGQELRKLRIMGSMGAEEFVHHVRSLN